MKKRLCLYLFLTALTLMQGCSMFFAPDDEGGTHSSHPASISRINGINTLIQDTAVADPPPEEEP